MYSRRREATSRVGGAGPSAPHTGDSLLHNKQVRGHTDLGRNPAWVCDALDLHAGLAVRQALCEAKVPNLDPAVQADKQVGAWPLYTVDAADE